jgi:hypothetical protein
MVKPIQAHGFSLEGDARPDIAVQQPLRYFAPAIASESRENS